MMLIVVIPCYFSNYKGVGQVGQNHLTHFLFHKFFTGNNLIILPVSGSGFTERDSEKKGIKHD